MFTAKQSSLLPTTGTKRVAKTTATNTSVFVNAGLKGAAKTQSGNGAVKYSTTGNPFVDQFGKLGTYKAPRTFDEIAKDCETLWAANPLLCVLFMFYIRTVTRVVTLFSGVSTTASQKGAELKHEGIFRMIWLHMKAPETFWKNIGLFVSVGSWKDIITMLSYDLQFNGWTGKKLNWEGFGNLILSGLGNTNTSELVKKYLPTIKSNANCKTLEAQADNLIGKWICSLLFGNKGEESGHTYKQYRKLKSSGTAHEWQQLISTKKFDRIDFAKIHGRALSLLVRGKFLTTSNLRSKYEAWVAKPETEVKYTGFVHELFSVCRKYGTLTRMPVAERDTINKQFATLVSKAGDTQQTSLIVVRDTSGSMGITATGTNMTCYDIAKALALYFSEFLTGRFADAWIEFNSSAKMQTWKGATPLDKWYNDKSSFFGSTNFESVLNLFVKLLNGGVPESEFPTGILCISDGEFNPSSALSLSNVENAKNILRRGGFSEDYIAKFVIVLWNLQSRAYGPTTGQKFDTYGNVPNVFYFSGYSAATVSFLTGEIKNAEELFNEAMSQEILQMIEL